MDFVCPKCGGELSLADGRVKKCPLGHSYDRAKAGYYNLLLGNSSGTHGDNKLMLDARHRFLSRGFYRPLAEAIKEAVLLLGGVGAVVLDAGAGEGYYTELVERALFERDGSSNVLAFDISKEAARYIPKRDERISVAVASSYDIPLPSASVDIALNVFAPMAKDEIKRVLKSGGKFIIAFPDRLHLFSLKKAIYKTPYENNPDSTELDGFRLLFDKEVKYNMELSTKEDIESLFMMTPYAYRTGKEERERVLGLDRLICEAEFRLVAYELI